MSWGAAPTGGTSSTVSSPSRAVATGSSFDPGPELSLTIDGPSAPMAGPLQDNLVLRAARALAERAPGLRLGRFHLRKVSPGRGRAWRRLERRRRGAARARARERARARRRASLSKPRAASAPMCRSASRRARGGWPGAASGSALPLDLRAAGRGAGQSGRGGVDRRRLRRAWPRARRFARQPLARAARRRRADDRRRSSASATICRRSAARLAPAINAALGAARAAAGRAARPHVGIGRDLLCAV